MEAQSAMIFDKSLQFSDSQALTGTSLVASTDHLDLGQDRDIGPGTPLWLVVVSKAAPGGTSPTLTIAIETDSASNFGTKKTLASSGAIAGANFGLGAMHVIPWPFTNERYARVAFTPGGTSPTFTVDAFLTNQPPPNWQALPDAI
jgi:hypothetical protein